MRGHIDIKKFLPHRNPMLMVSELLHIGDATVTTAFYISKDCIFTNSDILTESGLIENAAQACSAIVGQSYYAIDDLEGEGNKLVGYISAIKKIVIFKLPKIGETINTKAQLLSRIDSGSMTLCSMECTTFVNTELIVACTLNFLIQEV
ncbi:ABC transporter permease [Flavobacteriaceae bacterium F89]|uniref:ABC transporter permease n=1 Tax=Cerina litoralis TaxID=2874477 RepID=A0AAE3EV20_9FLAO|nr:ABC transporter permease [Cerina litoralis]MCG2460192.1 ABC transporter permease [Cerina litoralis]